MNPKVTNEDFQIDALSIMSSVSGLRAKVCSEFKSLTLIWNCFLDYGGFSKWWSSFYWLFFKTIISLAKNINLFQSVWNPAKVYKDEMKFQ